MGEGHARYPGALPARRTTSVALRFSGMIMCALTRRAGNWKGGSTFKWGGFFFCIIPFSALFLFISFLSFLFFPFFFVILFYFFIFLFFSFSFIFVFTKGFLFFVFILVQVCFSFYHNSPPRLYLSFIFLLLDSVGFSFPLFFLFSLIFARTRWWRHLRIMRQLCLNACITEPRPPNEGKAFLVSSCVCLRAVSPLTMLFIYAKFLLHFFNFLLSFLLT